MASGGVSSRLQPPQEYDEEEEEEEENESDTYSEDDPSSTSSDADTEPEVAVNLPQTLGQARDSAIEVDEETEDEEVNEEEIKERVENGEEKGKGDVGIELGDNSVLPSCPVCMEPWTSEGPHRVCCIPCGHVYGRLCLEKWLLKCRNKGKCPQCNAKFNPKQIINLYAPRIVVPNDDLEKEVKFLRVNIKSLILEEKYERAMVQKYGEDRDTWPTYDGDVWYSTGISDQNSHGDNYGLGALGKTRSMFRSSGSSSAQLHSSMPPAPHLTEEYIDMISSLLLDRMEDRFMSNITEQINLACRAFQGGSSSQQASIPAPQDDGDDDKGQGLDVGGDGTA